MYIGTDKILHLIFSCLILLSCYIIIPKIWLAIFITLFLGVAKELYDLLGTGFCVYDLMADLIGIVLGLSIIFIIKVLVG